MQIGKIRRRSNGTIDIDAYIAEARALRAQACAQFFEHIGRTAAEYFRGVFAAFIEHPQDERPISPRYLGRLWCDSTERELSDAFMGRHAWFSSKPF
jgi:hypothetical protein